MKEKILAYLQTKRAPASVAELVRNVVKVKHANLDTSRRLIESILERDARFHWSHEDGGQVFLVDVDTEPAAEALDQISWGIVHIREWENAEGRRDLATLAAARVQGGLIVDRVFKWMGAGRRQAAGESDLSISEPGIPESDQEALQQFLIFLRGTVWVSFEPKRELALLNRKLEAENLPAQNYRTLGLRALTKKLFPGEAVRTDEEAAVCLGMGWSEAGTPEMRLRLAVESFFQILDLTGDLGITKLTDLCHFQDHQAEPIDWSRFQFDEAFLAAIPRRPGMYVFSDRVGRVLYVGKAKNLNSRIHSYFQFTGADDEKKRVLRQSMYHIGYEALGSELEALIREAETIKALKPLVNTQMDIVEPPVQGDYRYHRLLVLPALEAGSARLFLLRKDKVVRQITVARDGTNLAPVLRRIKDFFFQETRRKSPPETWKGEIILRWLRKNRDHVSCLSLADKTDWQETVRLLRRYLEELPGHDRVIHR
ncbi:MAG: GIY-YIG nuclease family protein [Acidobacteria bacterium]|nr:GIY-YIG nuclease family protein [Acidobacteriota bacterium]MBI3658665.1 GIY-YIG nuclease family protein [Acidobacteriota bacterium]